MSDGRGKPAPEGDYGARVDAVDPRTCIMVYGRATLVGDGDMRVEPVGPAYPPGKFEAPLGLVVRAFGSPRDPIGDAEMRRRKEWDVLCMCVAGALRNLDEDALGAISSRISGGHL